VGRRLSQQEAKRLLATFKYSAYLGPRHCAVIRVPNMMCLTSFALALVLVTCVKVRKAK
jgi:hypothetical protein